MMRKTFDWRELFQKLAALPIFKSHFAWGPLNAFVLLAGSPTLTQSRAYFTFRHKHFLIHTIIFVLCSRKRIVEEFDECF